jgi:UDP-glucose 4-epimerase
MSRVLVTGGAGFIGSNTVDLLVAQGHEVSVVDDLSTGKKQNLNPDARFYATDITSPLLSDAFCSAKPEFVIHLAAQIDVRKSVSEPSHDAEVNVLGTINVLQECRRHGVKRVIYASSGGAVYGEPQYTPVDEKHPIAPLCPYGASKYAGEKYVELYGRNFGLSYCILRYGNVFGPRQDPLGEAGVIAIFTGLLATGKQPLIFGDGLQTRDFCFVADVAEANIKAMESDVCGAFNIGSGKAVSVNEVTALLLKALDSRLEPGHSDPVQGEVRHIFLDVESAKKKLGWVPKTDLMLGIESTVEWVRNG